MGECRDFWGNALSFRGTVSSTGAFTAAKAGIDKDTWTAVIATFAINPGR